MRTAQTNSKSQWAATTQDTATAVASWRDRTRKVASYIEDVSSRSKGSAEALSALHEEGVGHHRSAARLASTRAGVTKPDPRSKRFPGKPRSQRSEMVGEDVRLSSAFGTLLSRHDELESIETAAEAERRQSLAALTDSADAASADVARSLAHKEKTPTRNKATDGRQGRGPQR
eukprot:6466932-Amphidinium_carterae.1